MFMLQTEHGQLVQQSWQRQSEKKISRSKNQTQINMFLVYQ